MDKATIKKLKFIKKKIEDAIKIQERGFWTVRDSMADAKHALNSKLSTASTQLDILLKARATEKK